MNKNKKRENLISDIGIILSDERKQKLKDYQKDYQKKILCSKKLNKIINNDNENYNDNDSDFYCIIKVKNIVPIKDINSILKINKKVCSQVY